MKKTTLGERLIIVREVKKFGQRGAHIIVPAKWVGSVVSVGVPIRFRT